jgi:LasA protease
MAWPHLSSLSLGWKLRKLVSLLILTWLSISLACNFPAAVQTPAPARSSTPTPVPSPSGGAAPPGEAATDEPAAYTSYYAQSGDTLEVVARHFGVQPNQVTSAEEIPARGLIAPGQLLTIPNLLGIPSYPSALLPDSEVIDSPSAADFNIQVFIDQAGGFLSSYSQQFKTERLTGAEIVQKVVENTSTNPRLLLAVLEFRTHWVYGNPSNPNLTHPLGFNVPEYLGLYLELSLAARILNTGYYGWRQGNLTTLGFLGGQSARLAPQINAGTAAVQYLFAGFYPPDVWQEMLYGQDGFPRLYERMFGDPWVRAAAVEPLFPAGLQPPVLELPFAPGEEWSLTGGLHPDWNTGTPWGALDFAPIIVEPPCAVSVRWVLASAPGVVIRSAYSTVLLELNGDGRQHAGWVLLYMHIAQKDRVAVGTHLYTNDVIGHPSCEGGDATGTHVHLARKYNGEWIGAGDALPFVLSEWTALPGDLPYQGTLVKWDQVVTADPNAAARSRLTR